MARTTNTDTLPFVNSRYELGMLGSQRVRDLTGGAAPVVSENGDKLTVLALREIASGKLDIDVLRHEFVQSYKTTPAVESEENIESQSEAPELREIDAELENALLGDDAGGAEAVAEELEDSLPSEDAE